MTADGGQGAEPHLTARSSNTSASSIAPSSDVLLTVEDGLAREFLEVALDADQVIGAAVHPFERGTTAGSHVEFD